jgi:YesN/AraC family two-component response regulator
MRTSPYNGKYDQAVISTILQLFWLRLLPQLQVSAPQHLSSPELPTAMISYISEHFCEPLTLEVLSNELGVCRFYLSRIFTRVLHTGFHEYINTLRVDYAKKILLNTKDSILDVAIQCGFQNQQTFNRVFKDICGVTPSAYRKSIET